MVTQWSLFRFHRGVATRKCMLAIQVKSRWSRDFRVAGSARLVTLAILGFGESLEWQKKGFCSGTGQQNDGILKSVS